MQRHLRERLTDALFIITFLTLCYPHKGETRVMFVYLNFLFEFYLQCVIESGHFVYSDLSTVQKS